MTTTVNGKYMNARYSTDSVSMERIVLTPAMAERLLAGNTRNRAVIKSYLKNMEQVLVRNEWRFNGEPIIISSAGRVLDGQHRLIACVNTGVSIDTLLVRGVDESVFPTIDRGISRTVGNVLSIEGVDNYNSVAASLKVLHGFCSTGGQIYDGGGWTGGFSASVALEFLEKHGGIKDSVRKSNGCNHYKSKSLLGGLHYILSLSDAAIADDLLEVLASGATDKDRPFNVLREHLIYTRMNRVSMGNRSAAAKTIRAFNAEATGEWIKKVQWKPDGQFPRVVGLDYENLDSLL